MNRIWSISYHDILPHYPYRSVILRTDKNFMESMWLGQTKRVLKINTNVSCQIYLYVETRQPWICTATYFNLPRLGWVKSPDNLIEGLPQITHLLSYLDGFNNFHSKVHFVGSLPWHMAGWDSTYGHGYMDTMESAQKQVYTVDGGEFCKVLNDGPANQHTCNPYDFAPSQE